MTTLTQLKQLAKRAKSADDKAYKLRTMLENAVDDELEYADIALEKAEFLGNRKQIKKYAKIIRDLERLP